MQPKEKLTLGEKKQIFKSICSSLINAFKIRHSSTPSRFSLPRTNTEIILTKEKEKEIVFFADMVIYLFLFWKPGKCFYRTYALATLFRKWGKPLKINFGCENIHEMKGRAKAHCWLTLYDLPFAEKANPFLRFPVEIETKNNDIKYWFSDDKKSNIKIVETAHL